MEQRIPESQKEQPPRAGSGDRVLLVMPAQEVARDRDEITLSELWSILCGQKWLVIGISLAAVGLSVAYALLATQWYRAEVLLVPVKHESGGLAEGLGALGGLGGLASIAGINIGADDTAEPIAVLKSRAFTRAFIEDQKLLPVLYARKWDAAADKWKGSDPLEWPEIRDAVRYFHEKIRRVDEDEQTGLVTLSIEWTDSVAAAKWANLLVSRLNERMRERAQLEAERNIGYLRHELTTSNVVTLQESVGRLLENEMQKLMVARGSSEYSFRVVDHAATPKWRSRPKRIQVVILGTLAGGMLAVLVAFLRHLRRKRVA